MMQSLNFGRIEDLTIREGSPVFTPPPRVFREIKLCGENGPRAECGLEEFMLKSQVRDFVTKLSEMRNAVIRRLEIRHGLPLRMTVEEQSA